MAGVSYLDTSAIVKLVRRECESSALEGHAAGQRGLVSSALGEAETRRAVGRTADLNLVDGVDAVFEAIVFIDLTRRVLSQACAIEPFALRTLDAIHLATALALDDPELEFITYDDRLARAATANGLRVVQPGR